MGIRTETAEGGLNLTAENDENASAGIAGITGLRSI